MRTRTESLPHSSPANAPAPAGAISEFVQSVRRSGAVFWVQAEELRCEAPPGALGSAQIEEIRARRTEIIEYLTSASVTTPEAAGPDRRSADREFRLSPGQERLWFLEQLDVVGTAYNMSIALHAQGLLDERALRASISRVIARHQALRTRIETRNAVPRQVFDPPGTLHFETIDLRATPDAVRESEISQRLRGEANWRFDLSAEPLLRICLIRRAADDHIVVITMHHIIADGWSFDIFIREVRACYIATLRDEALALPPVALQFPQYAQWQRDQLESDAYAGHLAYWKKQLTGIPASLELPTDHPRPALASYKGAVVSFDVGEQTTQSLQRLAREERATLFMVFLAAFNVVLWRWSGQDDIAVGTPIAGRSNALTEDMIGFLVNTLVLRTNLGGNPTFRALLGRIRDVALEGYAHEELPFETLVAALDPQRDLSRQPLFQVMMVMDDGPETFDLPGVSVKPLDTAETTAKFDLTLSLTREGSSVRGAIEYATDLFERASIERLSGHLQTVLRHLEAQCERPVSLLEFLTATERRRLLLEWNPNRIEHSPHRVEDLIGAHAGQADLVAIRFGREEITFRELHVRSNQLAHYLRARSAGPESLVGLSIRRSPEMLVALLAILKTGAAYLPLDPALPAERLRYMVEDSGATLIIAAQDEGQGVFPPHVDLVCLAREQHAIARQETGPPRIDASGQCLAYVIYTSGSTGRPKGVMISHRAVVNYLLWAAAAYQLDAQIDGAPVSSPLSFDATITSLLLPLVCGRAVTLLPEGPDELAHLAEAITGARRYSLAKLTPSHLIALQELSRGVPERTTTGALVIGGEALTGAHIAAWREHAPAVRLINEYGPTETVVGCATYEVQAGECISGPVFIGKPIANTVLYVLDGAMQLLPVNVTGELYVGGAGVARGYRNRPGLTADRFVPDPYSDVPGSRLYRTGDLARLRPDGTLEYLGRIDQQVKLHGIRIEPGEIEASLAEHPAVQQAVVALVPRPGSGEALVAYVVPAEGHVFEQEELLKYLGQRLPQYMIPATIVAVDQVALTSHGKVDKAALEPPDWQSLALEYEAPATDAERRIASIWTDLLKVDSIGRRDNFFRLGGHSLLATRVVARIRDALNVDIPLRWVFEYPALAALSKRIESELAPERGEKTEASQALQRSLSEQIAQMSDEEVLARLRELKGLTE